LLTVHHQHYPFHTVSWFNFLSRWWRRPPAPRPFADPLDYALAVSLSDFVQNRRLGPAVPAFAPLAPAGQAAIARQLAELYALATGLGQQVNGQELTQTTAYEYLWQAYPQLDRGNLGTLLWQAFVGTR
jgi:hypothetical protein